MRNVDEDTITQIVLARHAEAPNARLKQLMTSIVQHVHAFARDVQLTEEEWFKGIQFLTEVGHITDDKRQEFILLSDTLGLSMLVTALNNRKPQGCTESTVFGPFPGFEPFSFYQGYSANFFDDKHYVIKGGSARTAECMLRPMFRNWFQPHYQYVYAGFRCVNS